MAALVTTKPTLLQALHTDHRNVAKLLKLMEGELARFDHGQDPDYALVLDVFHYLSNYPDQIHHPNEDLLYDKMLASGEQHRDVLETLLGEHEELATVGRELNALYELIVNDAFIERTVVHEQTHNYLRMHRQHMGLEERVVFPAARHTLTDEDWVDLEGQFAERQDPLFGDIITHEYQAIRDCLD